MNQKAFSIPYLAPASFVFFLSLIAARTSFGYAGAVTAGTGGAGRAAVEASETPFANPAGLAFLTGYYFTAGYGVSQGTGLRQGQDMAISLTDNLRETVIPTSLSYVGQTNKASTGEEINSREFKLSFGNFVAEKLAFGLGVVHQDDRLPEQSYQQTNLQTGFLYTRNKDLGFALIFDNLFPASKEVPEGLRQESRIGTGVSWNFRKLFRFKVDYASGKNSSFSRGTTQIGMESYLNKWVIMRLGGAQDNQEASRLYSGGLGFVLPRFGLHYAYQKNQKEDALSRHSVDLAIPVW